MISIVIPAYNEARYLARCLKSFQEQDYSGKYEIIVVDNGSNDNTARIAHSFGVRVISCPRRGVVYARQAGFRASAGQIITQADADTVYPAHWLSRIAEHFSRQPQAVAVAGEANYVAPPLWSRPFHFLRRVLSRLSVRLWQRPAFCLACAFAFRREALVKAGGYNIKLPFIGDEHDLLVRLSKVGKIVYDRHLVAETSSRRYNGGLWRFLLVDELYHALLVPVCVALSGRSLARSRGCPRQEPSGRALPRWALSLGIMAITVGILSYGYFSPSAQVFGKTYDHLPSLQKVIALSFDDGPNEPYTSQVLDILGSYGVKATFFVIGKNVAYYPEVTRRIVAEGHVLGNHSYTHRALTELEVPDYSELDRAQGVIYQITGVRPHLFRPPYGRKTPWELEYVKKRGLVTVTWSNSANDPHLPSPYEIEKRILQHAHSGTIILLHDGGGTKHGADRSRTVAALPGIIESLQAQGYTFVTVPELLGVAPYLYEMSVSLR